MKKILMSIAILMFVCCDEAEATNKDNITNKVIQPSIVRPVLEMPPVEVFLDDMTFSKAFGVEHSAKGEGHTFWWRGDEYTTDLLDVVHRPVLTTTRIDVDEDLREGGGDQGTIGE